MLSIISLTKERLSEKFLVDKEGSSIRILVLNKSHNATVEKSLYFDSGIVRIYCHNFLVDRNHPIYTAVPRNETVTPDNVAEYLAYLAEIMSSYKVCSGVETFQPLWKVAQGHIDNNTKGKSPCFRHLSCLLLVLQKATCCKYCNEQRKYFRKKKKKQERRLQRGTSDIANKHLEKHELREKLKKLAKERKVKNRAVQRLQNRLKLCKEKYIKLSRSMHNDFYGILEKNQDKMTELQKLFWESQIDALKFKNRKSIKWHPMMIRIALHIQSLVSNEGYEEMRKFIALPSRRRLYDYTHVIEAREGCQEEILSAIREKAEKSKYEGKDCHRCVNVMFDEMNIHSGLVIQKSTGELIGYTNLSEVETELKKLNDHNTGKTYKPALAKKVLVYLAKGITSTVHDIVAIYSTDDLTASQLYSRTWDVIYHLEGAGLWVLTLTCDGASTNQKFFKMHAPYKGSKLKNATLNVAAGEDRPIFFIFDPPHLMKTARNCFANSFAHTHSRNLWKNNEHLSWQVLKELVDLTSSKKFKAHKLTKAHIKLTSFSRMKVSYAVQVFSKAVADYLLRFQNHERFKKLHTKEIIKFILLMNRFFDCLNGKEVEGAPLKKEDYRAYRDKNDERFSFLTNEFLNYFNEWSADVKQRKGFNAKEKGRMTLSHQTIKALHITTRSFIGAISFMLDLGATRINARVFNQDGLEQYFSIIRRKRGSDNNPTLKGVMDARNVLHVQGNVAVGSSKGNTLIERSDTIDSTPLPALKRRKQ